LRGDFAVETAVWLKLGDWLLGLLKSVKWNNISDYKLKKRGHPFYIDEFEKHITVYKSGHGIFQETLKIKVLNYEECDYLARRLNIEDAAKGTVFLSLEDMKETDMRDRFIKQGFWYESQGGLVGAPVEFYWSDDDYKKEDARLRGNPKEFRFRFSLNRAKRSEFHNITYAISLLGMFPITDGCFDGDKTDGENYQFGSSIRVNHTHVKKLKYILSFEKGMQNIEEPNFTLTEKFANGQSREKNIKTEYVSNVFYDRYIAEIEAPSFNNRIKCKWVLNNKRALDRKFKAVKEEVFAND
jgi:hypothetical protein